MPSPTFPKSQVLHHLFEDRKPTGSYILTVSIPHDVDLNVGALGPISLDAGTYAYAGSALGPGGIPARVQRHLRSEALKRKHWHIDEIMEIGQIEEIWWIEGSERQECDLAARLRRVGELAVASFGSSDCRCPGHLIRLHQPSGVDLAMKTFLVNSRIHRSINPFITLKGDE